MRPDIRRSLRLMAPLAFFVLLGLTAWAAPAKPQLQITGYVIDADLDPAAHKLSATAQVTFTALDDLAAPVFELNNGLQLTKVTDANRKPLEAERLTNNSTVRFNLANPIAKGTTATFGAAGLVLAATGVFGVIAFVAAQRSGEMAVRLALGAPQGHVFRLVMFHGGSLAVLGLALGGVLAWWTGQLMERYVYQVSATNAVVLGSSAVIVILPPWYGSETACQPPSAA